MLTFACVTFFYCLALLLQSAHRVLLQGIFCTESTLVWVTFSGCLLVLVSCNLLVAYGHHWYNFL